MYKEVAIMLKNKERYVDKGGVFGLSIINHVTLQKIVAHDFRYDPRMIHSSSKSPMMLQYTLHRKHLVELYIC